MKRILLSALAALVVAGPLFAGVAAADPYRSGGEYRESDRNYSRYDNDRGDQGHWGQRHHRRQDERRDWRRDGRNYNDRDGRDGRGYGDQDRRDRRGGDGD